MSAHSDIDVRMKKNYEHPYRIYLTRRVPVIVRIDGKAFHTFTKGFDRPFDIIMIRAMQDTMKYLCENIMGCQIGYCQSDEISLFLKDYQNFQSQPYFDYNIQKISSICASMATLAFNKSFASYVEYDKNMSIDNNMELEDDDIINTKYKDIMMKHEEALKKGAMFDCRCFNVPKEEVTNYFYSRQLDASRNSVEMVGRAYFSHKELHNKNNSTIQDMLHEKFNINWNNFPTVQKRGSCCIKKYYSLKDGQELTDEDLVNYTDKIKMLDENTEDATIRSKWIIDYNIPQFKGEGREYIEKYVD